MSRKCRGSVEEVSRKCLGSVQEVSRKCLGSVALHRRIERELVRDLLLRLDDIELRQQRRVLRKAALAHGEEPLV